MKIVAKSKWWGRQDSNLRSDDAADLQSAPFATRDTPPLDGIAIRFAWRRRRVGHGEVKDRTTRFGEACGRARLWGKHHGKVNQGEPRKLAPTGQQAGPNCHCPEPVTQACHE